ncbi:MAG: TIGR00725 family protein [Nanoarchaeota archaeon]
MKLQIGVMGSCADLKYAKEAERLAEEIGAEIAKRGHILVFGAEKDMDSLSTASARGAKKNGGLTVGVTYGKGKAIAAPDTADVIIATGLERGGGREFVLVNSCDVIITIAGGSGTVTEMAIAYQSNIPIIAITGSGGWSDRLAGEYFDGRKRVKVLSARTPEEAVDLAITMKGQNEKI